MVRRLFGVFAALQTFVWLARRDRFEVLLWWTGETWLYVLLLWLKDLALAGAAGLLAACLLRLVTGAAAREGRDPPTPLRPLTEAAWVLPILALGAGLRWIFAAWNPPGLWVDVVYAARPLFGREPPPFWGATRFGMNPASHEVVSNLYVTFVRGVFALFGSGETGFFAISALPGTLALPALWWLAREAFGARTGILAALCGALLGWPLLLARWTSTAALLLTLVLLGAAAALAALRTGRLLPALLSGACVGLSLHTHASAGAVAAGFAAFGLLQAREKRARRLVLGAGAVAALAFAPLAFSFVRDPGRIGGHLRDVHLGTPVKDSAVREAPGVLRLPAAFASNALEYSGVLLWTRDPNLRHAAGRTVLSPLVGAVALLGFGLAAARQAPADVLLLLVASGSLLAGILSNPGGAPNTLRVSALAAPAAVLAAAVFTSAISRVARAGRAREGILLAGLAALLVAVETLPALIGAPGHAGVAAKFCAMETETGRILGTLAVSPVLVERGAVPRPVVVEAVAHGRDRSLSLDLYPVMARADIRSAPPAEPFWLLATPDGLASLAGGGLVCGRGIAPAEGGSGVLLARVRPPT